MKKISGLIGVTALTSMTPALAWEYVLIDDQKPAQNWSIDSQQLGIQTETPFSIQLRTLHGGRQEGVSLLEIDNGTMRITLIPTRGMNVLQAEADGVRLGWDSPVEEVVNPAFIELNSRAGLGWLEGFNELVTRCGYEWVGHPGVDQGELLTLHGRASNIPASQVILSIDPKPPYTIRVKAELREQAFKKVDFAVTTEISTEPGSRRFTLNDTLTNQGDYPKEYQVLYHNNFGPPLLEQGARFVAPIRQVSPFNTRAVPELEHWDQYQGPTPGYDETVYNLIPYGDSEGNTLAILHNQAGTQGVQLDYNLNQLPVFSLWKNTDSLKQGYVTGLEPGTSFSYNRRWQRDFKGLNLVPQIGPGEQRHFQLSFSLLKDAAAVSQAVQKVESLQAGRDTELRPQPLIQPQMP